MHEARLFDAIAGATLTDALGTTYGTRILRSMLPDKVPARSSVAGTLVFEPLPLDWAAGALVFVAPNISVGDKVVTLKLDLALEP